MRRTEADWSNSAKAVVIDVLEREHAVTVRELEARAADRTWNPSICNSPVQPHLLSTAVHDLILDGVLERTTATTRGGIDSRGVSVATLSLSQRHAPRAKKATRAAAARKRLLTARHNGWASRGLIGPPGELAMWTALREVGRYADIRRNLSDMFGHPLLGEVDLSCVFVDTSIDSSPVVVVIEVKNTREWYYDATVEAGGPLRRMLRKAAVLQLQNPNVLVAPMLVLRKAHATLWRRGEADGFLVASTSVQLVHSDSKLSKEHFGEVRDELGYIDLRLDLTTTPYHRGIAKKMIPARARETAKRWRVRYRSYLDLADVIN